MKVAYLCHWNPFIEDGVVKKINAQVSVWRNAGADVRVFCLSEQCNSRGDSLPRLDAALYLYGTSPLARISRTAEMTRAVRRWKPDVVYFRYRALLPPPVHLMRDIPTVVEVNTDDRSEYPRHPRVRALYKDMSIRSVFRRATGFTCVTPELAERVAPSNGHAKRMWVTNGIQTGSASPLAPTKNAKPRFVFLGSALEPWHGVDKILWLAAAMPECDFEIIGRERSELHQIPKNVTVHGFLASQDYERILASADVAVGTVALHRNRMSQAAPLKVREYLLRGLPVIIGYDDPDLDEQMWFVLHLANTENNVVDGIDRIREFAQAAVGRRVDPSEIAPRIDIVVKEEQRLAFLRDVARSSRS